MLPPLIRSVLLLSLLNSTLLAAPLGTAFTYQGRLNDGGSPATGLYDLRLAIYDAVTNGNTVSGVLTNAATPVSKGLFTVALDFGSVFTGNARWLEIGVRTNGGGAFTTLAPRQELTPTPYAIYAASAAVANTASTALTASSVAATNVTGTLKLNQLPGAVVTNNAAGVTLDGAFTGNGAGLTNIPFTALPAVPLTNNQSGVTLRGLTTVSNLSVTATNFVNYLVVTNPPALNGSAITNLNASQLTVGTVPLALLPGAVVTNNARGVQLSGIFSGDGAGMTNVNLLSANSQGALGWTTNWGNFVLASSPGVGNGPLCAIAADLNADGKVDLVSANYQANTLSLLTNSGSGGFVQSSTLAMPGGPNGLAAADVNGDGRLDLISANYNSNTLVVLTNNSSGGLVPAATLTVGSGPNWVIAADVNGDAKPDLISANYLANTLSVLTNLGSGHFSLAATLTAGIAPWSVTAADVNGDGKLDLICANNAENTLSVLTNKGSSTFALSATLAVGAGPEEVAAADVNGDGKPDLICANDATNTLTVLTNEGSGRFVLASSPTVGNAPGGLAAVDANGDGKVDLISANWQDNTVSVLTNNGSGSFSLAATAAVGRQPYTVAAADFNGDGKVDLMTANYLDSTLAVLFNVPASYRGNFAGNGAGLTDILGTLAWQTVPGTSQSATPNTGYLLTNAGHTTVSLPASANVGDLVRISGAGTGGWEVSGSIVGASVGAVWKQHVGMRGDWACVASSADGTKLAAGLWGQFIYTSTDSGTTWLPRADPQNWIAIASSADGTRLAAVTYPGQVYTSTDSGTNWTARATNQNWSGVASSADGTKLVATVANGQIYTSSDSGTNWTARASSQAWRAVASSSDGTKLVAAVINGQIYTSSDSGMTWTAREQNRTWSSVASSADGTKLVAAASGDQLYTSTDSGTNWTAREDSRAWMAVASSADGTKLVAAVYGGQIYNSTDAGVTWTPRVSNQDWMSVASSVNGDKLVAVPKWFDIYTSAVGGGAGETTTLQYLGNGQWQTLAESQIAAGAVGSQQLATDLTLAGTMTAAAFAGDGAGLTDLDAGQLSAGVVPDARLSANVALLNRNQVFTSTNRFAGVAQLTNAANTVAGTFSGNGAGVTGVNADQLDGQHGAFYLSTTNFTGTLSDARLSANVALLNANQAFTGSSRFAGVALLTNVANTVAGTFSGNGAGLTNVNADQLDGQHGAYYLSATNFTGTLSDARLSTNVALLNANQAFTASNRFAGVATLTNAANTFVGAFTGNAGGLTNLDAADLTGTLADVRLSANVALLNANQAFTGPNRFAGVATITNAANTLAGTFTGNGGGLTNLISSGNFVFSYSTVTQEVVTPGSFQDITLSTDAQISGWTHTAGTASFTCGQSGLYWVQYKGQVQFSEASSAQMVSLRAVLGGAEIAGSDAAVYGKKPAATSADDVVLPVSAGFIASFTAGNVLKFQITGASGSGLLPNTGYSTTRPSFSCTIMRLQ